MIDYASSKGALHVAAKYLAFELGHYGIRVNTVRPGYIDSEKLDYFFEATGRPKADVEASLPLRRLPTDAEIAQAVLFYASDMASAVTGNTIDVNAGEWMGA